jgi:hypothetical protein
MVSLKSSSGNRAAELFGLCARGVLKWRIAALRERERRSALGPSLGRLQFVRHEIMK